MSRNDRQRRWHLGHALVVVIAGVMAAGQLAQPRAASSQPVAPSGRVAPDPNVVAALQAIQTAYDHKDVARYGELLTSGLVGIWYDDKGATFPMLQMSRDDIIKKLLGRGEEDTFSPFIDATPISKRVLYAENIPGGQRARVLLLNRPVPKAAQTVSWVMDMSVTRQGGAAGKLMLSEITILPADLAKQVFWPMVNELAKKNLPPAQSEPAALALYNQYWAKFAATMPKPEAMPVGPTATPRPSLPTPTPAPVGPTATPRPPSPPSNLVVRQPGVIPPPPPPVRIPTLPTAFVTLPKPPAPTSLPPELATQRVQKLRTQIDDIVRRNFVDFVDRPLAEQHVQYGSRRFYVNVYQNRVRASYGTITLVITINLVFVQPPRGPMTTYMVPTMEPDQPEPVILPPALPQTPIALPPPAASVAGCMVLTDTAKLKAKHGARFDEISRYLASFGRIIDLAGANINPGDFKAVDAFVKKNFDRTRCDCLFIFGNHDVVPFASYPNPTTGSGGDPDPYVLSDDIYGDFDHDAQADPEIMVVRMPDDPGILADPNSVLYRPSATAQKIALPDYAVYGNTHRTSPPLLAQFANPGKPELLERSTPLTATDFSRGFFSGHNALINLHGSDAGSVAGSYWGEQSDSKQVVAMTADQAVAPDGVVLCCACYGASTAIIQSDGSIVPKSSDSHIALRFLRNGASAFIGYTRVTWQAVGADALTQGEGFASKRFIELTRQGQSPQKAYQLVKREMAQLAANRDPQFKKMYRQMVYLGLPPTGQRAIAPVATPDRPATLKTQLVNVLQQTQQAAQQRNVDALTPLLTPTIRDGIQDGPNVDARTMAQRIIDLPNQVNAANPLADKSKIDERLVLVQKTPDNEFVASLRAPVNQNVSNDPSAPKQPLDSIARVKFRQDGDQMKISGWETQNQDFAQQVTQPTQQWAQQNNITNPAEVKDKQQDLVEDYIDKAVAKAAQSNTDVTYAANPLAVTAQTVATAATVTVAAGEMPTWAIIVLVAAGGAVLLMLILVVALRGRGQGGGSPVVQQAAGGVVLGCPQCGRQHVITAGYAGVPVRCPCGAILQAPAAGVVGAAAMPAVAAGVGAVAMPPAVQMAPGQFAPGFAPRIAPRPERGGRCGRIIFFGLLLLAAFFIPDLMLGVDGGLTAKFNNLELLGQPGESVSGLVKFLVIFPAAAALLAIVLAIVTDLRFRGVVLAALPWVPGVVLCTQLKEFSAQPLLSWLELLPGIGSHMPWLLIVFFLGLLTLWVGSRARWYRPHYHWLYLVTLAGGAGVIVSQVVPPTASDGARGLLVAELIRVVTDAPGAEPKIMAVTMLAGLGLMGLACLLALFNFPGRRPSIRGVAGATFRLAAIGMLLFFGVNLVLPIQRIIDMKPWTFGLAEGAALLKQYLLLAGLLLLFLGGLVDLIIGPAPRLRQG